MFCGIFNIHTGNNSQVLCRLFLRSSRKLLIWSWQGYNAIRAYRYVHFSFVQNRLFSYLFRLLTLKPPVVFVQVRRLDVKFAPTVVHCFEPCGKSGFCFCRIKKNLLFCFFLCSLTYLCITRGISLCLLIYKCVSEARHVFHWNSLQPVTHFACRLKME